MLVAHQLCLCGMSVEQNQNATVLALGSNKPTPVASSADLLNCGLDLLKSRGLTPIALSSFYVSQPLGSVRQPAYVNAVVVVRSVDPVGTILRKIKKIERDAGRRMGIRWGPRVLDIDIISHRSQYASGHSLGWVDKRGRSTAWRRGQLALPHPELHRRKFVLQPLCDIMPLWVHPVFNLTAEQLLRRLPRHRTSRLVQLPIDNASLVCDHPAKDRSAGSIAPGRSIVV